MLKRGKRVATTKVSSPHAKSKRQKASEPSESEKAIELYSNYVDKSGEIGPEGVEKLCADLSLDPTDRKVLILAWKMKAERMGYFSPAEFERGLRALSAFTLDKIKKSLKLQEEQICGPLDREQFPQFFEFSFKYCLTEPRQKIIDIDTAVQMLTITMVGRPHCNEFVQFLSEQKDYKTINFDQWQGLGRFSLTIRLDCSNFDDEQAWPLILDQYVDWRRQGHP